MGRNTDASGSHAVASGEGGAAEGALSSAMGYYTTAQSYAEVVLGRYNQANQTDLTTRRARTRGASMTPSCVWASARARPTARMP